MKKIIISVVLAASIIIPLSTFAAIFKAGDQIDTGAQQIVSDDLYIAAGTIHSNSLVQGDLVIAGGTVSIMGSTTQDVVVAGGTVTILGNVGDDLRVAGGDVTLSGKVGDDAILAGGQVTLVSGSSVGGDAVIAGDTVTINGVINGDVQVIATKLILSPAAVITGNLTYTSQAAAQIQEGAQVRGETKFTQIEKSKKSFINVGGIVFKLISLFVIALLIQWLFRRRAVIVSVEAQSSIWKNLGRGLLALIVAPILVLVGLVTVIGIPVSLVVLFLYIILILIAGMLAPVVVGALVMKYYRKSEVLVLNWKSALIGALILVIVGIIPIVGGIVNGVVFLVVFGTLVKNVLHFVHQEKEGVSVSL